MSRTILGGINAASSPFVFDVRAYGASGNGTTDDTAEINLAIAALNAAGGGVLYFPAGFYKVTSPPTTIVGKNVTIKGDGIRATRLMASGFSAGYLLHVAQTSWTDPVSVFDLSLMTTDTTTGVALRIEYSTGNSYAITSHVFIHDVEVIPCDTAGGPPPGGNTACWLAGFDLVNVVGAMIHDCALSGMTVSGETPAQHTAMVYGISLTATDTIDMTIIHINNVYANSMDKCVYVAGGYEGVQISHSVFTSCNYGVYADLLNVAAPTQAAPHFTVSHCHVGNFFVGGIYTKGVSPGLYLNNNLLYGAGISVASYGIHVDITTGAGWPGNAICNNAVYHAAADIVIVGGSATLGPHVYANASQDVTTKINSSSTHINGVANV